MRNRPAKNLKNRTAGRIILAYTLFFACMAGAICLYFALTGRTFVRGGDAFRQHLKAMVFYSRWLRTLFSNLFSGDFTLPSFSFSLGYGGDILTTFHHYGLGEPLCFFSVFVPEEGMLWFYSALSVIRLYLAGLSFLAFLLYQKRSSGDLQDEERRPFVLESAAGALTYVFSAYPIMFGLQHPHFLSAFILFPLILLGIDKVIREKKPAVLVLSVFLSGLSSFYFLYMMAILAVVWYFIRRIPLKDGFRLKDLFLEALRILLYAILGLCMAGVIIVPVVWAFVSDARSTSHTAFYFFYTSDYYRNFLHSTVSSDYMGSAYGTLGFGALFLASVSMLVLKIRKFPKTFATILLLAAGLLLPVFGYLMNGFSYVVNRWLFAFCLSAGLLVSAMIEEYRKATLRDVLFALFISAVYVGAAILVRMELSSKFGYQILFLGLFFVCVFLFVLLRDKDVLKINILKKIPAFSLIALLLVSASLLVNDYLYFRGTGAKNLRDFVSEDGTTEGTLFWDNDARLVSQTGDQDFYRFYTEDPEREYENSSVLYGLSSTQFYWSMSNPYVSRYMTDLGVSDMLNLYDCYHGLDDRTALMLLAGVRYDLTAEDGRAPYSYERIETLETSPTGLTVYRSDLALPFAYTVSERISEDTFYGLAHPSRQLVLTRFAVAEESASGAFSAVSFDSEIRSVDASVLDTKDLSLENFGIRTEKGGAELTLKLEDSQDCETYVYVKGLHFEGQNPDPKNRDYREPSRIVIRFRFMSGEQLVSEKELIYRTAYDKWGKDQCDFLVNSGYHTENVDSVRIIFAEQGYYSASTALAYALDPSTLEQEVAVLTSDPISQPDFHDGAMKNVTARIDFTVDLREEKTVVTQVPYSGGWQVYVDGEKRKTERINIMYTGLSVGPGVHEVSLRYHTPGSSLGLLLTILGTAGFLILLLLRKRKKGGN